MPDAIYAHPRLAAIYDALDPDRSDLDSYVAMAEEFGAHTVVDLGCGTGTLALMLAERGFDVLAVEPAAASLDVARSKIGASRVRWVHGDAESIPPVQADIAFLTANVAQVFLIDEEWMLTLSALHRSLRPGGRLVFESRIPARRAWLNWGREQSFRRTNTPGVGAVESWSEVTDVTGELVSFRWTYRFSSDGSRVVSDSTLRFRDSEELKTSLTEAGFTHIELRDAPDRAGLEFVFIALREPTP